MRSCFPLALASAYWLLAAVTPSYRRAQIRPILQGLRLQFLERDCQRLVFECARDIVIGGHRFVTQLLPEVRQRLGLVEHRLFHVGLELHQLELDLQVIVLADAAVFELDFADVDGLSESSSDPAARDRASTAQAGH